MEQLHYFTKFKDTIQKQLFKYNYFTLRVHYKKEIHTFTRIRKHLHTICKQVNIGL